MISDWWSNIISIRPTVVRVQLTPGKRVIVPSDKFPLKKTEGKRYEIFSYKNCSKIEDKTIIDAVDTVEFKRGYCYTNSEAIVKKLQSIGIDAVQYCGWCFNVFDYPIHHSWVIVNGKYLIDLSAEFLFMDEEGFVNRLDAVQSYEENMDIWAEYISFSKSYVNSIRCKELGWPSQNFLYIGVPCDSNTSREIINKAREIFPDHPSYRTLDSNNKNKTQRELEKRGILF